MISAYRRHMDRRLDAREARPPRPARRRPSQGATIAAVVLAVLLALGIWHEIGVLASRGNPPASCQLLGGEWNILTGWQCGVAAGAPTAPSTTGVYSQQCVSEYGAGFPFLVGDHCEATPG